jgi:signal transduction histidine kinase
LATLLTFIWYILKISAWTKSKPWIFHQPQIDEFEFMNQTIQKTTNQAQQEYSLLKEFTENASHEMQTPLAIIRSKLDLLIQDENLSEDQSKTMQSAYSAMRSYRALTNPVCCWRKLKITNTLKRRE